MKRYAIILSLASVVAAIDQWTKVLVIDNLKLWSSHPIIEGFFNLVHVQNRGAAFGFLNSNEITWQFWLFTLASLAAVVILFYFARTAKEHETSLFISLGLVLGGAVGNFVDRLFHRYVTDFLDFHVGDLHWPAFNVADIAICVGVGIMLLLTLRQGRLAADNADNNSSDKKEK